MAKPSVLICTVGTSLFVPNLNRLCETPPDDPIKRDIADCYRDKNWHGVAECLQQIPDSDQVCGAEINSIASLIFNGYVAPYCGLYFMHSDTNDGNTIATILVEYFRMKGHSPVEMVAIKDLQDTDPKRFRTKGLRELARQICKVIRDRTPAACAINATGGYKAQIAIAVLLGQAIEVPVFYKHERFPEIISFPPMPVALDFELWMKASGMLFDLERNPEPTAKALYEEEWNEKYECLVEQQEIDGIKYIDLSPTGQIFHETFRERFRNQKDQVLPPAVPESQKKEPTLERAGWPGEHPEVRQFLQRVTNEIGQVIRCATFYYNPSLSERTRFRLGSDGIEGIFSDGSYCVKFRVKTSAKTDGQRAAVVATLNEWLSTR